MVGQSCPGYYRGDVDCQTNLMLVFGAWHTRNNDAKDHSLFHKKITSNKAFRHNLAQIKLKLLESEVID